MNFGDKGDLCEYLSTQIPLFPGLCVTDVSAFSLVTRSGRTIASKSTPVKSKTCDYFWKKINSLEEISIHCFIDTLPHLTCRSARKHCIFLISSTDTSNLVESHSTQKLLTHHISQRLKSSFTFHKINTATRKHFLAYIKYYLRSL